MGIDPKDYQGREQAFVKHTVLDDYVQMLALKVGQFQPGTTLNYVDGFSGPYDHGVALSSEKPTSPYVALTTLKGVRDQLRERGIELNVRGLFVEAKHDSFLRLEQLCGAWPDVETVCVHGQFEDQIERAVTFAKHGPRPFAFAFIDPTGWTGFGMRKIAPLLRAQPSEVLVNFMLKDILRFIDDERAEVRATFEDLFGQGADTYRVHWRGLSGLDREDAIVSAYCSQLKATGQYTHCVSTVVINPRVDRTHYHLVFATRSLKGLTTFREIERHATKLQKQTRAEAKQQKREQKTLQLELLAPAETENRYVESLAIRYRTRSQAALLEALKHGQLPYDEAVAIALGLPLCDEAELKTWIAAWAKEGRLELVGLAPKERVPKVGLGHVLRWLPRS
jgi:three-Cys-motif partner protein